MKLFASSLALGLMAIAGQASAQVAQAPTPQGAPGVCVITAQMRVTSFHIVIGGTSGEGTGTIQCTYTDGGKEIIPISVRTSLGGIGLGISEKTAQLMAEGIGIAPMGARDLLGRYTVAKAAVQAVVVGAEGGLGLTLKRDDGFSFPATLGLTEGLGLEGSLDAGEMIIQPLPQQY